MTSSAAAALLDHDLNQNRGSYATESLVRRLVELAGGGLAAAYQVETGTFPQTMRGRASDAGPVLEPEGTSGRYAAMAALGISRLSTTEQQAVLAGGTAAALTETLADRARGAADPGLLALSAWAAAEVGGVFADELFADLARRVEDQRGIPTVDLSWILTAAVAAVDLGPSADLAHAVAQRLVAMQFRSGVFAHTWPADAQSRPRRHIGCFADEVYPIQALSRFARLDGNRWLAAAERCAAVITARQGVQGQWWWHYDVRDGSVVEGFPVYSVHQHAMAPMALADLRAAGGVDYTDAVDRGLRWLTVHPETVDEVINDRLGVVWRKVGRWERGKVVRKVSALTTSVRSGWHAPGIDRVCPPGQIDRECRPYELGWLLYAHLPARVDTEDRP